MAKSELDAVKGESRKWKIEGAAQTLLEAEKIKRDKPLLRAARAELKRQQADMKKALSKV